MRPYKTFVFLVFSRQTAKNEFLLKLTILCDIAVENVGEGGNLVAFFVDFCYTLKKELRGIVCLKLL